MARIWTDGAEHGDASRIATFGAGINGSIAGAVSSQKRNGTYCYEIHPQVAGGTIFGEMTTGFSVALPSTYSEFYLRLGMFRIATGAASATTNRLLKWMSGATEIGALRITLSSGIYTLLMYDGTTLRLTSSNIPFSASTWYVWEIRVKIAGAGVGVFDIKVNGVDYGTFTGVTNTNGATIDTLTFGNWPNNGGTYNDLYIDDIAVNDTSGAADNSWCGDGGVLAAQVPTGAGNYTDWSKGGTSVPANVYQAIDEVPNNGDTDFAYDSTSTHKSTFAIGAVPTIPTGYNISRVIVDAVCRGNTSDQLDLMIRSNATDDFAASQNMPVGAYGHLLHEWLTDPGHSNAAWTEANVNATEVGMRTT